MKPWIIAGLCCVGAGVILCTTAISVGALNQSRYISKLNLTDQTDTPDEAFTSVLVDVQKANVTIEKGDSVSVTATNIDTDHYSVSIQNNILQIHQEFRWTENWMSWIQIGPIGVPTAEITITLPESAYRAIGVSSDFGDCTIQDMETSTLTLETNTGNCTISNVVAESCTTSGDLGDLTLENSTINGTAMLQMDTGDMFLQQLDIRRVCSIESDLGNVELTDISCGSTDIALDCGNLDMTNVTETDADSKSALSLDLGDIVLDNCTLFQTTCELDTGDFTTKHSELTDTTLSTDCGDIETTDTALIDRTEITVDVGSIRLNLRGEESDYLVLNSFAGSSANSANNVIVIEGDENTSADISEITFSGGESPLT